MGMPNIKLPGWAPKLLIGNTKGISPIWRERFELSYSSEHLGKPWITERQYTDYWKRLLTDQDMKQVFSELKKLKIGSPCYWDEDEDGFERGNQIIEEIINNGLFLKSKNDLFTNKQKEEWFDNITRLGRSLINQLQNTHIDRVDKLHRLALRDALIGGPISEFKNHSAVQIEAVKDILLNYYPVKSYSEVLEELLASINQDDFRASGVRKNEPSFKRAFFVRRVAESFNLYLGENKLSLVTILARSVFDQPDLLESKVSSLLNKNT